jgi:hypothetical protein
MTRCNFIKDDGNVCGEYRYIGVFNKDRIKAAAISIGPGLGKFVSDKLTSVTITPGSTHPFTRCEKHCMFKDNVIGMNDLKNILLTNGTVPDYHLLSNCKLKPVHEALPYKCTPYFREKIKGKEYHDNIVHYLEFMDRYYTDEIDDQQNFINEIDTCIQGRRDYNTVFIDKTDPRFYYLPPLAIARSFSHGEGFIIKAFIDSKQMCENNLTAKKSYGYKDVIKYSKEKYDVKDEQSRLNLCINPLHRLTYQPSYRKKCDEIKKLQGEGCDYNEYFSNPLYNFEDEHWAKVKNFYRSINCTEDNIKRQQALLRSSPKKPKATVNSSRSAVKRGGKSGDRSGDRSGGKSGSRSGGKNKQQQQQDLDKILAQYSRTTQLQLAKKAQQERLKKQEREKRQRERQRMQQQTKAREREENIRIFSEKIELFDIWVKSNLPRFEELQPEITDIDTDVKNALKYLFNGYDDRMMTLTLYLYVSNAPKENYLYNIVYYYSQGLLNSNFTQLLYFLHGSKLESLKHELGGLYNDFVRVLTFILELGFIHIDSEIFTQMISTIIYENIEKIKKYIIGFDYVKSAGLYFAGDKLITIRQISSKVKKSIYDKNTPIPISKEQIAAQSQKIKSLSNALNRALKVSQQPPSAQISSQLSPQQARYSQFPIQRVLQYQQQPMQIVNDYQPQGILQQRARAQAPQVQSKISKSIKKKKSKAKKI